MDTCTEHDWPAELASDARCEACGLPYGQWMVEDLDAEFVEGLAEETGLKIHRQMAYQGDVNCTSMQCRRFFGDHDAPSTCAGWHCAQCRQPSGMYGHPEGECP